jgi:mono/diheme cytochrome c family protein
MKGVLLGLIGGLVLLGAVFLAVVYTGAYNVAATDPHADIVRWALGTTQHRSVAGRAEDVEIPEDLAPELVAAGAPAYAAMCAHCHAGPGVERAAWASGMRPMPPELIHAATEWEPREVFWILQNGIKMSGMPAFGPDHGDQALIELTAFVGKLPGMTPEEYRTLTEARGRGGGGQSESGGED